MQEEEGQGNIMKFPSHVDLIHDPDAHDYKAVSGQ